MSNEHKLVNAFASALGVPREVVADGLTYESIPEWDSVAHMALVAELERAFDVMLDTDDIIAMSSMAICRQILTKHGVTF